LCGDTDHQGDFGNQSLGNDGLQSPAMCFFPAKLVDDQQIDSFKYGTLDPCVNARESVLIKATTPRFVTTVQRDFYFVTAQ
jgi:hypothetical protein